MNRPSAFSGVVLLLCACSAPDPDAAAQQLSPSQAVATDNRADAAAVTDSTPVTTLATATNPNGDSSMRASDPGANAVLRPSYEACITQSGGVTPAMQDCIASEAEYQDGRLSSALEQLRASLPPAEREALDSEHSAWLGTQDEACMWNADEEGQAQRLAANECTLKKRAARATDLWNRLDAR